MKIALPIIERQITGQVVVDRWGAGGSYSKRPIYSLAVGQKVLFDRDLRIKDRVNAVVRTALLAAIGVVILPAVLVLGVSLDLARGLFTTVRETLTDAADVAVSLGRQWLAALVNTAKEII